MKQSRSEVRNPPEPETDPFMDEAMAMVYVGDVYSLVAQEGSGVQTAKPAPATTRQREEPQEDNDTLLPFIR